MCFSNTAKKNRMATANPAALGPTLRNAVNGVGAPSYTSGHHMWNGTLAILYPTPARTKTTATTSASCAAGWPPKAWATKSRLVTSESWAPIPPAPITRVVPNRPSGRLTPSSITPRAAPRGQVLDEHAERREHEHALGPEEPQGRNVAQDASYCNGWRSVPSERSIRLMIAAG